MVTLTIVGGGAIEVSGLAIEMRRDHRCYLSHPLPCYVSQHADRLTVLAVNMRESEDAVAAYVAELGLRMPVLLAPDDATLLAFNVRGLPISFLIDPDRAVVQRIVGPVTPGCIEAEIDARP